MNIPRRTLSEPEGIYDTPSPLILQTGSTLLDCALGGGWARHRIINLVGDRSTGKTLLAIEGAANFHREFPKGVVDYIEFEAAFDTDYAQTVGFPEEANLIENLRTVEDLFKHLTSLPPGDRLVVVDSLDAVGAEGDLKDELGDHGFGTKKPKMLSEMFMRLVRELHEKRITLVIISQVRTNITGYGPAQTRSGGKALDFYSSQIVWLKQKKVIEKVIEKVTRTVGIEVQAKCTKNKIGPAFREAPLEILFGYGMDNLHASLYWLADAFPDMLTKDLGMPTRVQHRYDRLNDRALIATVDKAVREAWDVLEEKFAIPARKYEV